MKVSVLLKLGAVVAVMVASSKTLVYANVAELVPDGTYVFDSTDGNTALNGSTITFSDDAIVSWDLLDATISPGVNLPPLTPANSSIVCSFVFGATDYGSEGWYFTIASPVGVSSKNSSTFWFESENDLSAPGAGGGTASFYDGFGNGPNTDPAGNWALAANVPNASTPDAASTLELFAGALTALGVCKSFLRRCSSRPR
jgi:hypothetical protein